MWTEGRTYAKYWRPKEFGIFEDLREDKCDKNIASEGRSP